jgi:quinol monooxygenase YgiN
LGTVLLFERYPVDPRTAADFERLLGDHLDAMRRAPGSLLADAGRALDDEPSVVVWSEWREAPDLDAWEATAEAASFADRADALLRAAPTRRRFTSPA